MAAYTPIITGLNSKGNTFYTFASAARDLSKCLGNSQKKFRFSKFVCLNIPDIQNDFPSDRPSSGVVSTANKFHYQNISGLEQLQQGGDIPPFTSSEGLRLLFEDYVLNFEQLLMKEYSSFLPSSDISFAERVWWNFLINSEVISLASGQQYLNPSYSGNWYAEDISSNYEPVVVYVGDIDITNNIDISGESYTELYMYIPSEHGNTPEVLFKEETSLIGNARGFFNSESDNEFTYGHAADQIYAVYDDNNAHGYKFNNSPVVLGLDPLAYKGIALNQNIHNFAEFNKTGNNFEFNTVLVYYDIIDESADTVAHNLYGVMFLDDVTVSSSSDYIQRFPKYKAVGAGTQNGNAFGIKLNLRIDTTPDKPSYSVSYVNEYNTFSMGIFAEASAKIHEVLDNTLSALSALDKLSDRVGELENIASYIANYQNLEQQVKALEEALENAGMAFADKSVINNRLVALMDSLTELRSSTSLNNIKAGYGIEVSHSADNIETTISNKFGGYNIMPIYTDTEVEINPQSLLDLSDNTVSLECELAPGYCCCIINTDNTTVLNHNLEIHLNTSVTDFINGQCAEFIFKASDISIFGQYSIILHIGDFTYVVSPDSMNPKAPKFRVICLDENMVDSNSFIVTP